MIAATPLLDLFEQTYRPRKQLADATVKQHRTILKHFHEFLGRPPVITDLDEDTLALLASWLVSERQQAAATVNMSLAKLHAQWSYYNRRGMVEKFPDHPVRLREPKRLPQAYRLESFEKLLTAAQAERGQVAGIAASRWWYTLLLVMYDTGLRIGAMLELNWAAIDFEAGSILAAAETQKQFADQLFFPAPETLALLREMRFPPREIVFPWPQSSTLIYDHFKAILERAELPAGRRDKFHKVRRTTASHIKAAGGNATEHLGHSSPRVTEAYIDERIAGARCQAHLLPRPFAGQPPKL